MNVNTELKLVTPKDSRAIYRLVDFSRDTLALHFGWAQQASVQSVHNYICSKVDTGRDTMYTIRDRTKSAAIGADIVGVIEMRDRNFHFQVGYWIDERYRGSGFASTALKLMIDRANKPVVAQIHHNNTASRGVLQKAGMMLVGADSDWQYYSSFAS